MAKYGEKPSAATENPKKSKKDDGFLDLLRTSFGLFQAILSALN
jgi:hypothetical protein